MRFAGFAKKAANRGVVTFLDAYWLSDDEGAAQEEGEV